MAVKKLLHPNVTFNIHDNDDSDSTPRVVKEAAGTIHFIFVDNSANAAISYLKLYFVTPLAPVVVGTTVPDFVVKIPGLARIRINWPAGKAFSNGLVESTVTTGGTAGTTSPVANMPIQIAYD